MINDSAENAYRALGLSPDAGWVDIRRSYRRLARQWHPDRYSAADAANVRVAEERFKELSAAYQYLVRVRSSQSDSPAACEPAARLSRAPFVAVHDMAHPWPTAWKAIGYILLTGSCALLPFLLFSGISHLGDIARDPPVAGSGVSSKAGKVAGSGSTSVVVSPRGDQTGTIRGAESVIAPIGGQAVTPASRYYGSVGGQEFSTSHESQFVPDSPPSGVRQATFTRGATKADVRRIQGVPVFESESKWTYGPSYIYFAGDRVRDWYSSPAYPLRISP